MPILQLSILLLLISCQSAQSQKCQSFIDNLFSKYSQKLLDSNNLTEQERFYVQYSGRQGFRDLGERALCEAQPSMTYYALIKMNGYGPHHHDQDETGICVIKECTMEILGTDDMRLRQLFALNNWDIENENIKLYDPNQDVPKSFAFYLNLIFQIALVIIGVSSTIIAYKQSGSDKPHWLVEAFDARASLKSLLQTAQDLKQNEDLATFGFFKIVASWWVVALHTLFFVMRMLRTWQPGALDGLPTFFLQGNFAVDFFFFISGFLAVYVLTAKFKKEALTPKTFFQHMKHRFLRIWPLYIMAIIFYALMVVYMFHGPLWERYSKIVLYCDSYWWQKLFLIDNLIYTSEGNCLAITWYVSFDFQSYALVLVVIFLYAKSRAAGYISTLLLIIISHIIAEIRMEPVYLSFSRYYIYTPARMGDIFIGILCGMHYYDYAKLKQKFNIYSVCERLVAVKYIIMGCGCLLMFYLSYYIQMVSGIELATATKQATRERLACVAAALFSVITAQGPSRLKLFFNLRIWQILSKLSYGLYLFHFPIIFAVLFSRDEEFYAFSLLRFMWLYIQIVLITYFVCIFYWVFFERPISAIEAHFSKRHQQAQAVTHAQAQAKAQAQAPMEIPKAEIAMTEQLLHESQVINVKNEERDELLVSDQLALDKRNEISSAQVKAKQTETSSSNNSSAKKSDGMHQ